MSMNTCTTNVVQGQRFVVRASVDRRITEHTQRLFATLEEQAEHLGCKSVPAPAQAQVSSEKAGVWRATGRSALMEAVMGYYALSDGCRFVFTAR